MTNDPIVEEVHEARRRLLSKFNGDIEAYLDFLADSEKSEEKSPLPPKELDS